MATLRTILAQMRRQMAEEFEWRERNAAGPHALEDRTIAVVGWIGCGSHGDHPHARRSHRMGKTGHKGG